MRLRPVVGGVYLVSVEDGVAVALGEAAEGRETYRVPLPAVVAEPSTDGLFKTGEVELDARLSELTEVTVLVPVNE